MSTGHNQQNQLATLASHGFGVYHIAGGKLEQDARFAIADQDDDEDGFYLEGSELPELLEEAISHLEISA